MKHHQYTCLVWAVATALLFQVSRVHSSCVAVDNPDLIEYNCEGGSVNDIQYIPKDVEKIRIHNMPVGVITDSMFSQFRNLLVLTCSECMITDIQSHAFRQLENLQQLSLDNNKLKEVRGSWFEGLAGLTYLDLNYNEIERVDPDVFRNTRDLVDLRLSGNQLRCLDTDSMSRLKDLKRMFINENPKFTCVREVKDFLGQRGIEYEADPHWNQITPSFMTTPPSYTRSRWPVTETPYRTSYETTTYSTPVTEPPRRPRPYVPEMIQPSIPNQDFTYQPPYYAPKVTQQQLDNYRNTQAAAIQNMTEAARMNTTLAMMNVTTPRVLIAGHQPVSVTTTTECPNAASIGLSRDAMIISLMVMLLAAASNKWTGL